MANPELLELKPVRIKTLSFFVNENFNSPGEIDFDLSFTVGFDLEKKILGLLIRGSARVKGNPDEPFIAISVDNKYHVENLKEYHREGNNLNLPIEVQRIFLSLSYSHTRALLAERLEGTKFRDIFIPIVNTDQLLQAIGWVSE